MRDARQQWVSDVVSGLSRTCSVERLGIPTFRLSPENACELRRGRPLRAHGRLRRLPPLFLPDNGEILCGWTNVGAAPHTFRVEIIRCNGTVSATLGSGTFPEPAGQSSGGSQFPGPRGFYYCWVHDP